MLLQSNVLLRLLARQKKQPRLLRSRRRTNAPVWRTKQREKRLAWRPKPLRGSSKRMRILRRWKTQS
jgi:hypothetical protein